jgi:hypothetical protein
MANGHFFGGVAEGIESARAGVRADTALSQEKEFRERGLGLQERGLDQQARSSDRSFGLQERALGLQEQSAKNAERRAGLAEVEGAIAETMKLAAGTISAGLSAGRDPEQVRKAVTPLLADAQALAKRIGKDPTSYARQLDAMLTFPGAEEAAAAEGKAAAAKNKAASEGGMPALKPEQRVTVEGSLRDDYTKQSAPFVETQDAWRRIQSIQPDEKTGAGDVALLYSYMKMLDPRSTVREGEIATAQNAAGVSGTVLNLYNSVIKGQLLTPDLRTAFRNQAKAQFETQRKQQDNRRKTFEGIATRQGADPRNVVIDFTSPEPDAAPAAPGTGNFPAPPPNFVIVP